MFANLKMFHMHTHTHTHTHIHTPTRTHTLKHSLTTNSAGDSLDEERVLLKQEFS